MTTTLPGRKAIAAALGFTVKEGRGRMPREVKEAVDAAIADGRYAVEEKVTRVTVKPAAPSSDKPVKVKVVKPDNPNLIVDPRPQVWPDNVKVFEVVSGKPRGNREVCRACGCSLQWCECHLRNPAQSPTIVASNGTGAVAVRLEV